MKITTTLNDIITGGGNIFDFDYSFYNDDEKAAFEELFVDVYLFQQIRFETVARFKHELRTLLNRNSSYYKQLYDTTLFEYDAIENYNMQEESEGIGTSNTATTGTFYDTPITTQNYKETPESVNVGENVASTTATSKLSRKGNIGVTTTQTMIKSEREIIVNMNDLIISDLEKLFMGVY